MQSIYKPADASEVLQTVRSALARHESLEIFAGGSQRDYARPVETAALLDVSGLTGITAYEPGELVLTARAATPLADIRAALAEHRQHLAFEPPRFVWLADRGAGSTLGGCLAVGLGGPRRPSAGAPRDHLLGFKAINGFGEQFSAGSRVIKNVTGFDLPKLMAGSLGTLAVMTEVTIRVAPAPPMSRTLLLHGLDDSSATAAMRAALASPAQVTAAAHLPGPLTSSSQVAPVRGAGAAITAFRLEGFEPSVQARAQRLTQLFQPLSVELTCIDELSEALWAEIGSVGFFAAEFERQIWRVSLPPAYAPALAAALKQLPLRYFFDWGGSLLWLEAAEDSVGSSLRPLVALATHDSGSATLVRGSRAARTAIDPLPPLPVALAALTERVKHQFDPERIFNPGRMYRGL